MLGGLFSAIVDTVIYEVVSRHLRRGELWTADYLTGALADADPLEIFMTDDGEATYGLLAGCMLARYPDPGAVAARDVPADVADAVARCASSLHASGEQLDALTRVFRRQARRAAARKR